MLESSAYSPEQLQAIKEYTKEIAAGLDEAEEDFDSRKHIVEMLNVYASLVIEDEEKVAYVTCVFKITPERLVIVSPSTCRQKKPGNHSPNFERRWGHAAHTARHPHTPLCRPHVPF